MELLIAICGILLAIGGILLAIVFWFFSPKSLKRRLWQFFGRLFRRRPAVAVESDSEVFGGRVEILTEELLSHPADAARIKQFYEIAPLDWDIIAAHADIKRDQQADVIGRLRQPVGSLRFICINGESGSGKSTLAWRVAAELHKKYRALVIRVKDREDPEVWYQMADFCQSLGRHFYVLADDLFRNPEVCRALQELKPWLPLTVLATSQTNEFRPGRLKGQVVPIPLGPPSREEKERVLRCLKKDVNDLNPEQLKRYKQANEFLVLMVELTSGKGFQDVVQGSLDNLLRLHEPIYRAYEYLCFAYSYGIAIPASLLERLDAKGRYHDLPNREGAQDFIFYDKSHSELVRPGHPRRAEMARRLFERHRSSATVLQELVTVVDASNPLERRTIAHLLRILATSGTEVLEEALPHIERHIAECLQQANRISELTIWRAFYLALERSDEADRCVDTALALEPVSSDDCNWAIMLYHERGRERDALPVLDRWIHDYPELGGGRPAYLGLVERYGSKSDQRRAIDDTSDWLAAHPDNNNVRAAYLGLVERKGTAEQTERMLQETSTWLVAHPDNNKVRATYLGLLERKGTAKQTERMLQETSTWLAKHPDDSEVRRPYLGLVEQKGTAAQTERVLQETSDWLAAHRDDNSLRATYLGLVGRKGTAAQAECVLQETSAWLVAHPDDTNVRRAYICLVLVDRKQDHLDEPRLRELYDAYIKFYPHDTVIREAWARWLHSRNYRDEAEEVFKALIAEHPRSFPHWYWYGRLLLDMKRYGEAADQFKQVLKIHRGHAMAHDGLALALQGLARAAEESQDHSEAARLFATAERELKNTIYWAGVAHERLAIFYTHLGWLYIDMKRWGDALGAFDQSVNENPEYFGNYWGQGRALMGLEQWHDAASALRTALEKAPDTLGPPASDDIRKLIEQSEAALTDNHPGESD